MRGTSGVDKGTSGGASGTTIVLVAAAVTLTVACVNSLSRLDEIRRAGLKVASWEPWVWELTSAAFWIAVAVPLVIVGRRLRPPRLSWPKASVALVALSVPVCALHLAWFTVSRAAIYRALGSDYAFDGAILYEWRKDVLSVFVFTAIAYALDQRVARRTPEADDASSGPDAPFRLKVRDGARTHWLAPSDIERIEAAGNYVELFTAAGPVLHRTSLTAIEAELGPHGFVRIHRSRLVRRDAVQSVTTTASGDFSATMASGTVLGGSRRFRKQLKGATEGGTQAAPPA